MLKLRKGGHGDLNRAWPIFEMEFDKRELLSRAAIHRAMLRGDAELLILYEEETSIDLSYALTVCRGVYGYVLLKYLG